MAVCNVDTLMQSAGPYWKVTPGLFEQAKLSLLCQILKNLNPLATCDVDTLIARGKCFCKVDKYDLYKRLELQLLCEIAAAATGGGGGGATQVLQDATGAPPPDPTKAALSFPTGGGTVSEWDVPSQTWI